MTPSSPALWIAAIVARSMIILLLAGLCGAILVGMAPGAGVDERELDPRLRPESVEMLRRQNQGETVSLAYYPRFIARLLRGDAGESRLFGAPVAQLIQQRIGTTARSVFAGLAAAWAAAALLAVVTALNGHGSVVLLSTLVSAMLLSVPSGVLAVVGLLLDLPFAAIAGVVFPRVYPHVYNQLRASLVKPHVVMARSRGLSPARVLWGYVLPGLLLPMVALAGVSVTLALGASIPVEALADSPGLGQLAWRAALARDLPLLVAITLLITSVTVLANLLSDIAVVRVRVPAQ